MYYWVHAGLNNIFFLTEKRKIEELLCVVNIYTPLKVRAYHTYLCLVKTFTQLKSLWLEKEKKKKYLQTGDLAP